MAGSVNKNFPRYLEHLKNYITELDKDRFSFLENPKEEEIFDIFMQSDAIILPYNASGGQSGVMHIASFYGLQIMSYNNKQLKEQMDLLGYNIKFVDKEDSRGIRKWLCDIETKKMLTSDELLSKLEESKEAFKGFFRDFPM